MESLGCLVTWKWKKLKDICEKGSSNIKQSDLKDLTGDYPIFGASGYIQNVDFYQRNRDYIGIIKDGSGVGRTMLLPAFSSVIGTLQYILPKEGNDIKFINYALQNIDFSKSVQGAAIPHIYFKDYGETEILVPPLSEQKRIVKFLDEEFSKIETLKTNAETNLKKAGAIFVDGNKISMFNSSFIANSANEDGTISFYSSSGGVANIVGCNFSEMNLPIDFNLFNANIDDSFFFTFYDDCRCVSLISSSRQRTQRTAGLPS